VPGSKWKEGKRKIETLPLKSIFSEVATISIRCCTIDVSKGPPGFTGQGGFILIVGTGET
jgi:hypothetical protein